MPVNKFCRKCGRLFELGLDGIWSDKQRRYLCDSCARVIRDGDGNFWLPGMTQRVEPGTGRVITREKALGKGL